MCVKDLNGILHGNILFRRWHNDIEEFDCFQRKNPRKFCI